MTFESLVMKIVNLLGDLVPLVVGFAVLVFLYGLFGYMMNIGDESKRKESISYIIYGLIGLFVMTAVWGLVSLLSRTFGFDFGIPVIL